MNIDQKRESEIAINNFLAGKKLNNLFKELINTLVHEQPEDPIPFMVN
jgi:hypothetical protein